MSAQAKRAYEGFQAAMGHEVAGPWDALPGVVKEAWRAAVVAAVDEPPETETFVDKQVRLLRETETAEIARKLKAMMPPDRGFILLTADYGRGSLAYVSTVNREDAIRMLREFLQRQGAL